MVGDCVLEPRVIESILLISLAVISIVMWRKKFTENLIDLSSRTLVLIGSIVLAWLLFQTARPYSRNTVPLFLMSIVLSSILFGTLGIAFRRRAVKHGWASRIQDFIRLPAWSERLLTTVLIFCCWIVAGVTAILLGEIASISPVGQAWIQRTFVWRHLVDSEPMTGTPVADQATTLPAEPNDSQSKIQTAAAAQADFFRRFSGGFHQTKQQILNATGLETVQREIQLTREVINLSDDEKSWLLTNHPALIELIDHPVVLRVIDNPELMARFERFAAGRADELLAIGSDPDINLLFEDESIGKLIREIKLEELLEQCRARRQSTSAQPTPTGEQLP